MGLNCSWIAVQGLKPEQALAALEMEVSEVLPQDYFPDGVAMAQLPGDWLLFLWGRKAGALEAKLPDLVTFGPAIACELSETVMFSEARGYESGEQIWRVTHDPNEDQTLYSLQVEGNPPAQLETIVRDARAEQDHEGGKDAGVDYIFDIPSRLAQSICGFNPSEGEPEDLRYSVLRRIGAQPATTKRSFFARLFGG
jgi:hypothetical protein